MNFAKNAIFENLSFLKNVIFEHDNFWIKCGFLPQCDDDAAQVFKVIEFEIRGIL